LTASSWPLAQAVRRGWPTGNYATALKLNCRSACRNSSAFVHSKTNSWLHPVRPIWSILRKAQRITARDRHIGAAGCLDRGDRPDRTGIRFLSNVVRFGSCHRRNTPGCTRTNGSSLRHTWELLVAQDIMIGDVRADRRTACAWAPELSGTQLLGECETYGCRG